LKIALKSDPRLYLLIVGEGKLMKNLVHQARELEIKQNLKFTGYQEDMRPIYELIDIFVLPSLSEGMPNAVMEAMAWGKPIVASAVGGVLELIEHQVTGILIPPGDPEKLAEALTKISRNIEWANQIGQNARLSVIKKYNLDVMVDSYSNLYDQLLGQIYSLYH
jgi:glycosyltransferase involved in cell wall biosynthesis